MFVCLVPHTFPPLLAILNSYPFKRYAVLPGNTKQLVSFDSHHPAFTYSINRAIVHSSIIKMKLTSAISALLLASSAHAVSIRRRLSYQRIAGYEPKSQVTDHNAIDLDQEVSAWMRVYSRIILHFLRHTMLTIFILVV
jgi:hypothetical protein